MGEGVQKTTKARTCETRDHTQEVGKTCTGTLSDGKINNKNATNKEHRTERRKQAVGKHPASAASATI